MDIDIEALKKGDRKQLGLLTKALEHNDLETIKHVWEATKGKWNYLGSTLLHWATRFKEITISQWLIEAGADVNALNENGETPLHQASSQKTIELLLTHGAEVNAVDSYSRTPLYIATYNVAMVQLLIDNGADVNIATKGDEEGLHGDTPLHLATISGNLAMVKVLVTNGAKLDIQGKYGKTPYDLAQSEYHRLKEQERREVGEKKFSPLFKEIADFLRQAASL